MLAHCSHTLYAESLPYFATHSQVPISVTLTRRQCRETTTLLPSVPQWDGQVFQTSLSKTRPPNLEMQQCCIEPKHDRLYGEAQNQRTRRQLNVVCAPRRPAVASRLPRLGVRFVALLPIFLYGGQQNPHSHTNTYHDTLVQHLRIHKPRLPKIHKFHHLKTHKIHHHAHSSQHQVIMMRT